MQIQHSVCIGMLTFLLHCTIKLLSAQISAISTNCTLNLNSKVMTDHTLLRSSSLIPQGHRRPLWRVKTAALQSEQSAIACVRGRWRLCQPRKKGVKLRRMEREEGGENELEEGIEREKPWEPEGPQDTHRLSSATDLDLYLQDTHMQFRLQTHKHKCRNSILAIIKLRSFTYTNLYDTDKQWILSPALTNITIHAQRIHMCTLVRVLGFHKGACECSSSAERLHNSLTCFLLQP